MGLVQVKQWHTSMPQTAEPAAMSCGYHHCAWAGAHCHTPYTTHCHTLYLQGVQGL